MASVEVNQTEFNELKKLYAKAVEEKKEHFRFQGSTLLTEYAKYLIEWLEPQFKSRE